jgi:membrane protease YdiL (CAAX protease family)
MLNRYLTYYTPTIQFTIFCAILSMGMLCGAYLSDTLNQHFLGLSTLQLSEIETFSNSQATVLKWLNTILLLVMLFLPALLFSYLAYPKPVEYMGLRNIKKTYHLWWALVLILIAMPFTGLLEDWSKLLPSLADSKQLDEDYDKLANAMLQGHTWQDLCINTLTICIAPAIIEEIFFRGCLQQILLRWMKTTPWLAILIVAIVFSAFHGQLIGFFPRLFLGLLLGWTYYYSGSLWLPILMHFMNNFLSVFLIFLFQNQYISFNLQALPPMSIFLGLGSGLAVMLMVFLFKKEQIIFTPIILEEDRPTETENIQD